MFNKFRAHGIDTAIDMLINYIYISRTFVVDLLHLLIRPLIYFSVYVISVWCIHVSIWVHIPV